VTQSARARSLNTQNASATPQSKPSTAAAQPTTSPQASAATAKPRKLSYKEQRELDALPALISTLEAEQKETQNALADPKVYATDPARVAQLQARDTALETELMHALERWEVLSSPT
jgi:ATP-binding cassette subfamily F protein uup